MANFLSMFHFQILHTPGKKNVVADASSRKPYVDAISVASHQDMSTMREMYHLDVDFSDLWADLRLVMHMPLMWSKMVIS